IQRERQIPGDGDLAEALGDALQAQQWCGHHALVGSRSPPTGTALFGVLSTMTTSQGNLVPSRHWPPTGCCSAMPGLGPVVKSRSPLMQLIFMVRSLSATSSRSLGSSASLNACTAISNRSEEHTSELQSRENLVC